MAVDLFLLGIAAAFPLPESGERDRVRGDLKLGCEHLQDAVEITENFIIPDPGNAISEGIQVSIAALIRGTVGMLSAIDLNDETLLAAYKIDVIRSDRLLARELQPTETTVAQRQPQDPFGPRASSSQRAGAPG